MGLAQDVRGYVFREASCVPVERGRTPRLMDQVRQAIRARHYSRRTEEAYVYWIRRYILFHGKAHPSTMGAPEISAFLT